MATKKRISELPICETFKGLFTIGVDALNHSVKVSLEFIDKTVTALKSSVDTAVKNADTATAEANKATNEAEPEQKQRGKHCKYKASVYVNPRLAL